MKELFDIMPQVGSVCWIGIRPEPRGSVEPVDSVQVSMDEGLVGDHFSGPAGAKRQVTLIQAEHIESVGKILGQERITPESFRRNIVVSGINLQALKDRYFQIGEAILFGTGNCPPCSRMEKNLGPGGYNAMRGHGGITARVVASGTVRQEDSVELLKEFVEG